MPLEIALEMTNCLLQRILYIQRMKEKPTLEGKKLICFRTDKQQNVKPIK